MITQIVKKVDDIIDKISFTGIVISVTLMLLLTVLNISLRWFNTSIHWIDPFVRHLVFLSAFLGGALATGQDNHIRIDLAAKVFESLNKPTLYAWTQRVILLITAAACGLLAKAGYDFTLIELEFGKIAFLGLHSGALAGIIPFGMGLICFRFILRFLLTFEDSNTQEGEDE